MTWLHEVLRAHPEIAFFLVLGLGYLLGMITLGRFKLGAVTGTLLAGVIVGQLDLAVSNDVKQSFFLLFLFAIGFRTGPQFFRGLKSDGLAHAALASIVAVTGLVAGYVVARVFGYDPGTAAGLLAGALTESATIGTAMDAIAKTGAPEATRTAWNNNIPVAFAVTYLVGVVGAAWVLSQLAPRLMRVDLAEECRKLEAEMRGGAAAGFMSVRRDIEVRGYAVDAGSPWMGRTIADLEASLPGERIFVERLRRNGELADARSDEVQALMTGDILAISGRRAVLVAAFESPSSGLREVDDRELLDFAGDVVDVVVTRKELDGRPLKELGRSEAARGVFLRSITRGGTPVVTLPETVIYRGDVLTLAGTTAGVARAVPAIGVADRATDVTNMMVVALAIVAGALIGIPALHLGGVEIGLSLPVGVLLGGLVCGWLRSYKPALFGRIPTATLWVFESIGLAGFVAVVGLNAGPDFVQGLKTSGLSLVAAGAITITAALLTGIVAGRWLFKMHPGVMLGVCAGGCTATPALAAVQEAARSAIPSIGYGVAYAVGNVLLAIWGTIIVALMR